MPSVSTVPAAASYSRDNCLLSHGIRLVMSYQPAAATGSLQWAEAAIMAALALAGYCFWRLSRRLV